MTDAIATNYTDVCDETITESDDTKDTKEIENIDVSCDVIDTTPLDGTVAENITSPININSTLESHNDNNGTENCSSNGNIPPEQTKSKVIKNSDAVPKYIYKKSEKTVVQNKNKGHIKNSIVRRKRSLEAEPIFVIKSSSPTSAEHSTSDDVKKGEEIDSTQYKSGNIIKTANLANFNIETLHEDSKLPLKIETEEIYNKPKTDKSYKGDYKNSNPQEYYKSEDVGKNINESTEGHSRETSESNENIDGKSRYSPYFKEKQNINESYENSDELVKSQKNKDIERANIHSKYIPSDHYTKENYEHDKVFPYAEDPSNKDDVSVETSDGNNLYGKSKSGKINDSYEEKPADTTTRRSLQDVDLGDFSYETIQVNDKGQVEPTKEHENYNTDDVEQTSTTQPLPKSDKNKIEPLTISTESTTGDDFNASNEQPVNINDEEVRPVVELNNEDDSTESNEENSEEQQKSNLEKAEIVNKSSEEDQTNNKEIYEKIVALKANDGEKVNVKQQVERIPLDYNHDDKSLIQKESDNTDKTETLKENQEEKQNDGTLDSLTPKVDTYDDNLNFKFDDIALKLPDIHLPDDILSYSNIEAPKKRKNKKKNKKFYHYSDEISEENQDGRKEVVNDEDNNPNDYGTYNRYIDKDHENYKITKDSDDEDGDSTEDLYEKFVRERFGKKGSFGKRSEKLQVENPKPSNPKLLKTLQTIFKQTEKVRDEAEKSGDPNAGYMWTLEYGENH